MSDTWSFEEFQDKYHSLNGGFHSEEEFKTAIAILNESNDSKIGSLLPRYNKQVESTEKYLRSKNIKYTRELSLKSCNGLFGKRTECEQDCKLNCISKVYNPLSSEIK